MHYNTQNYINQTCMKTTTALGQKTTVYMHHTQYTFITHEPHNSYNISICLNDEPNKSYSFHLLHEQTKL